MSDNPEDEPAERQPSISPSEKTGIETEISSRIDSVKLLIAENITDEGLLPEIGERGKEGGSNSEMLGYALRIAVDADDRSLFRQLKKGADTLKMENGLFRARLNKDKTPDTAQGITWADANQDIALAYIEGGEKWDDQALIEEGLQIAKAFIDQQVAKTGDYLVPLQNTVVEDNQVSGGRIRRVNMSMYNLRLYEKMQEYSPNDERWRLLTSSAIHLVRLSMGRFTLPPNVINLVDGKILTDSEIIEEVETNPELASTIPQKTKEGLAKLDKARLRPEWGFDSMRIPWRFNDSLAEATRLIADQIYERLQKQGGTKTKYYADTGEPLPDSIAAAVVTAPLLKSIERKTGRKQDALRKMDRTESEIDKQVLYWQLWKGLGLLHLIRR